MGLGTSHPTYMHCYFVSKYTPNLVIIDRPFLCYSLATYFDTLHAAHATYLNVSNPIAANFIELIYPTVKTA